MCQHVTHGHAVKCHKCIASSASERQPKGWFVCTTAHVSPTYKRTEMTIHWTNCILTDNVSVLEDQILACLSCWKALYAAAFLCFCLSIWTETSPPICPTQHDDWICSLSCSVSANDQHFDLLCDCRSPPQKCGIHDSDSFPQLPTVAYKGYGISMQQNPDQLLQCLSRPCILEHMAALSHCKCGSSWQTIVSMQMLNKGVASMQPCFKPTFV